MKHRSLSLSLSHLTLSISSPDGLSWSAEQVPTNLNPNSAASISFPKHACILRVATSPSRLGQWLGCPSLAILLDMVPTSETSYAPGESSLSHCACKMDPVGWGGVCVEFCSSSSLWLGESTVTAAAAAAITVIPVCEG